jgi:subtilisin family serine protease
LLPRRIFITVVLATVGGGLLGILPAASQTPTTATSTTVPDPVPTPGRIIYADDPRAVPGAYIVSLGANTNPEDVDRIADELTTTYGGVKQFSYTAALPGFSMAASADQAAMLAGDPRVEYVAQDIYVDMDALVVQPNPPSWGLDRIDQRSLPLDAKYHYPNTGSSVVAYIIDTGILLTHQEFGGRAVCGFDPFGGGCPPCGIGHGTHVAATVGGLTTGVAKGVRLVSVRVFGCAPTTTAAVVIAGVNYVTLAAMLNPAQRSVANMSLGGGAYAPMDTAVTTSIANNVHYSVAAGNSGANACLYSPARTPRATTVAATDRVDTRPVWSNFGTCVDVFAPGVNITSAWHTANNAYNTISGTSMASPHAAGTAALWRHKFPADNADQVAAALRDNATPGVVVNPGVGSPNLLLFMGMIPV